MIVFINIDTIFYILSTAYILLLLYTVDTWNKPLYKNVKDKY